MIGSLPCKARCGARSSSTARTSATTAMTRANRTRVHSIRRIWPTLASPAMAILQSAAPIFPTSDLDKMRAHYEALGFDIQVHKDGYATAARDAVRIHFRQVPDGESPPEPGAVYLSADDADALHAEWSRAGVGVTSDLFDPGFGVWEAAHTDPDGNLLRFGSPVKP